MQVPFSYLEHQFADVDSYLADVRTLVRSGDLTLGRALTEFEERFAAHVGVPYAVGVGSGTDALILVLKALGVAAGDEVITTPTTFVATVGAIVACGARPIFVDSEDGFVIDPSLIEGAITRRTKAIVPVHYTGNAADMPAIMAIAERHGLKVVEDACQAVGASIDGHPAGSFGDAAAFSLHPLKNINVWGDGGVIATRSESLAAALRLQRNHGLVSRDEVAVFGVNSRLDTLHAVIGNRLLSSLDWITERRIANACRLDAALSDVGDDLRIPRRRAGIRHVYHLYVVRAARRDRLVAHLNARGVEAKVHYPIPMHLQPAARYLGYREGDFPVAEADARSIVTLPAHQHLNDAQLDYVAEQVRAFY